MGFVYIIDDPEEGAFDRRQNWKELVLTKVEVQIRVEEWSRVDSAVERTCRERLREHREERCVALIHVPDWEELSDLLGSLASEHGNCLFVLYAGGNWQRTPRVDAPNVLRIECSVERSINTFITDDAVRTEVIARVCQWLEKLGQS